MNKPLKLRACDAEDIQVVAGYLQDAIVPIVDMSFLPNEKRFVMVVNRFKWETADQAGALPPDGDSGLDDDEAGPTACYERTLCGLCFDGIEAARTRGIDLRDRSQVLSLLTIGTEGGAVVMHFSGGGCLRLEGASWQCRLQDLGEPWPTTRKPHHAVDAA